MRYKAGINYDKNRIEFHNSEMDIAFYITYDTIRNHTDDQINYMFESRVKEEDKIIASRKISS